MKNFFLTDQEIQSLLDEPKFINQSSAMMMGNMKRKSGREANFWQYSTSFPKQNGKETWLIYLRSNQLNVLDFSCGLGLIPKERREAFMLTRYNGRSHRHTNRLESQKEFFDFHIHRATEKYQKYSYSDDHFAQPTDRYVDLHQALSCLLEDCNVEFRDINNLQLDIFQ